MSSWALSLFGFFVWHLHRFKKYGFLPCFTNSASAFLRSRSNSCFRLASLAVASRDICAMVYVINTHIIRQRTYGRLFTIFVKSDCSFSRSSGSFSFLSCCWIISFSDFLYSSKKLYDFSNRSRLKCPDSLSNRGSRGFFMVDRQHSK